jgi:hypothetical protein
VINEGTSSIKTLDVTGPHREPTRSTMGEVPLDFNIAKRIVISCEHKYGLALRTAEEEHEAVSLDALAASGSIIGRIKAMLREAYRRIVPPNAIGDVAPHFSERRFVCLDQPISVSGHSFNTSPFASTLDVIDKKYSEVFREIHALRQPEDVDELVPTDYAYWNALKIVAGAYQSLRCEHPRYANLEQPAGVVDSSGGVRLIWRTDSKQVKANFGARPDLKSYLYYESGQVYDVETLDIPTLARRLGWLI